MEKCAIYCRLSKEDEEKRGESESIQNQKSLLLKYASAQNFEVYEIYCDEDKSGADSERPAFTKLLEDARQKKFQVILCKTQSRFTRDMEVLERVVHGMLPKLGIRFIALIDNADTNIQGNKKARQINGLVNEWYLEDLSENIRAVLQNKRKDGKFVGSFACYGYQKDLTDKNKLIVDSEASTVVKRIFSLYLSGIGKQKIAEILNSEGVLNPTSYKKKTSNYKNGQQKTKIGLWNKTTIGRILKNEMYIGTLVQGKKKKASYKSKKLLDLPKEEWIKVPHSHEAIIQKESFENVQKLLKSRTRVRKSGERHILSGKVFCADCKSVMTRVANSSGKGYLRCGYYAKTKECSGHYIGFEELLNEVVRYAEKNLLKYLKREEFCKQDTSEEKKTAEITREIEKRKAALKNLYLDKISGVLTMAEFLELGKELRKEREDLENEKAALQGKIALKQQEEKEQGKLNRELLFSLIDRIEISEREGDYQQVKIFWSF